MFKNLILLIRYDANERKFSGSIHFSAYFDICVIEFLVYNWFSWWIMPWGLESASWLVCCLWFFYLCVAAAFVAVVAVETAEEMENRLVNNLFFRPVLGTSSL